MAPARVTGTAACCSCSMCSPGSAGLRAQRRRVAGTALGKKFLAGAGASQLSVRGRRFSAGGLASTPTKARLQTEWCGASAQLRTCMPFLRQHAWQAHWGAWARSRQLGSATHPRHTWQSRSRPAPPRAGPPETPAPWRAPPAAARPGSHVRHELGPYTAACPGRFSGQAERPYAGTPCHTTKGK